MKMVDLYKSGLVSEKKRYTLIDVIALIISVIIPTSEMSGF